MRRRRFPYWLAVLRSMRRCIWRAIPLFSAAASTTLTMTGPIDGSGSLTMTGMGKLLLNSANTFSGGLVVIGHGRRRRRKWACQWRHTGRRLGKRVQLRCCGGGSPES